MKTYTPTYYHKFRCLAGDCPDSCCKEWEVDIDPSTAQKYLQLQGALGDRLRQVLRHRDDGYCMTIENGRCPMWRQDGLCQIQAQLGHDALSDICRAYPRISHDYGSFMEYGMELSCPEAARLILTTDYEMESAQDGRQAQPPMDPEAMETLLSSRETALEFLETSELPLPHKLAVMLLYAHQAQSQLDGGDAAVLNPDETLLLAKKYASGGGIRLLADFYLGLEILTEQWRNLLQNPTSAPNWDDKILALARYGIYRYWLQAISDYDLVCRVKLIVSACLLVAFLGPDSLGVSQLFSKEIENSPDNLDTILDSAYASPALVDTYLLGLLINS